MDRKTQLRRFGSDEYERTIRVSQTPGWDYRMQAVLTAANKFGSLSEDEIREVLTGWGDAEEPITERYPV